MILTRDSLMIQMVKNLPAMQESQVLSLGGEDPLEKEMASCLENSMDREASRASPWGCVRTGLSD